MTQQKHTCDVGRQNSAFKYIDIFVHILEYVLMNFEWDPDKDAWNYVKHGIRFETAAMVFDDPYHVSQLDRVVDGEERWRTMA